MVKKSNNPIVNAVHHDVALTTNQQLIAEYIPALLGDETDFETVANLLQLSVDSVEAYYLEFVEAASIMPAKDMQKFVEALTLSARNKFVIRSFKTAKKVGVLQVNLVHKMEQLDKMLTKKMDEFMAVLDDPDNSISLNELNSLVTLIGKHQKNAFAMMETNPMIPQRDSKELAVIINNNLNGSSGEKAPEALPSAGASDIVVEPAGYVEPPSRD